VPKRLTDRPRELDEAGRGLAESHLHLVEPLAWEQYRRCQGAVPLDDLRGEAQFALVYAAGLYDAARGVPFGAYATLVIRHRLHQAVTSWRRWTRRDCVRFTDLVATLPGGERSPVDPPCPRTREPAREASTRELLGRARRVLPRRWFSLLELYYGRGCTLEEAGEELGVSRQRAQQLLVAAVLRVLRHRTG
jgi:RNA polymerase sigma factor (sigma-70 family)